MTDREKYQQYIGKVVSWKMLCELGVIAETPPLANAERRHCDECADWHYARGKCRKHYISGRRTHGKTHCHNCADTNSLVFWRYLPDSEVYCPSCVGTKQPFVQADWVKL